MDVLPLLERVLPELRPAIARRLTVLKAVQLYGPVGRRALVDLTGLTERVLRAEIEALARAGLVIVGARGVVLSASGESVLAELSPLVDDLSGLAELARAVEKALGIEHAVVVPGDSAAHPDVLRAVARAAAFVLEQALRRAGRIAVAGGTTMAAVAEQFAPKRKYPEAVITPARGGLGEHVDIQADTIAARLAEKAGARYVLLGVPDQLAPEALRAMAEDTAVRVRLEEIRAAEVVFHGIGEAHQMSLRRRADPALRERLIIGGAVSEAFGAYYDREGRLVAQTPTIGLSIEELKTKRCVAVAGGRHKAEAIASLARTGLFQALVTDQGAAEAIVARAQAARAPSPAEGGAVPDG